MASRRLKECVGAAVAVGLLASSSAAAATATVPPPRVSPWAALSALSGGAPAAAVCGASASSAAAPATGCVLPVLDSAPVAAAPPVSAAAPVAAPAGGYGVAPLLLGLVAIATAVGFWFAVDGHDHKVQTPVSPG